MGKYMRKQRTGRAPAAELAQVVVGVRTRSRSAAFASAAAAAAPAPKRPRKHAAAARAEVKPEMGEAGSGDGGCAAAAKARCYLQLRSRRLFMAAAAAEARCPVPSEENAALPPAEPSGASLEQVVVVAGMSRCSSTASSVDVVVAAARERNRGAAEVGGNSICQNSHARTRRRVLRRQRLGRVQAREEGGDAVESSAGRSQRRGVESGCGGRPEPPPSSDAFARRDGRAGFSQSERTPAEEEMEEFFAAAEKAEAERFAAKYNFDVARGLPLDAGGRFEWTTVAAVSG